MMLAHAWMICQQAMAAARQQAWTNPQGVLGLPARLGAESQYTRHWDLTAIAEVLDQAMALQWGPEEMTAWMRDDLTHHFAIARPGRDRDAGSGGDILASPDFDQALQSATVKAWEVDNRDGSVLYRGRDIELAWELAHSGPAGAHLVPAPPEPTAARLSGGGR